MSGMRTVVIREAGGPEVLKIEWLPVPEPKPAGCCSGSGPSGSIARDRASLGKCSFPRALGIEAVDEVVADPTAHFRRATGSQPR